MSFVPFPYSTNKPSPQPPRTTLTDRSLPDLPRTLLPLLRGLRQGPERRRHQLDRKRDHRPRTSRTVRDDLPYQQASAQGRGVPRETTR